MATPRTAATQAGSSFERRTRQRTAILDVLAHAGRPLSSAEVHAEAAHRGAEVSLATVYRAVRSLAEEGSLVAVETPAGTYYEMAGKAHHHHFSCTGCGRLYELDGCLQKAVRLPRGFRSSGHDLTVFGTCRRCNGVA